MTAAPRRLAPAALLALWTAASLGAQEAPPPGPDWDFVAFEVKSWGAPVTSWRMTPDGGGSWTEALREDGTPFNQPPSLAWHTIEPAAANYSALEAILRKLPQVAPDYEDCENRMTDAAYGTIRLTRGATTTEIAWNDGCFDEDYRAFIAVLKEADEHVAAIGKAAPVSRVEQPPGT